ncbi:hypothetical protein [Nocardia amamiensis]|uniref:hypothetical protein n=1 Tax=Nocardia amamiensis TaxID=404578 RepID=UPI0009FC938B
MASDHYLCRLHCAHRAAGALRVDQRWDQSFCDVARCLGIPGASQVMQIVVPTAVLSVLNSGTHTASRMLFALATRREAPGWLARTTDRGTRARVILLSMLVGWVSVGIAHVAPGAAPTFAIRLPHIRRCLKALHTATSYISKGS